MKKIIFIAAIIICVKSFSQSVAINTTGNAANSSAMLDVSSTNKGFLAPRMTTAQRTSIASPADGLLAYDTDTKSFWYFSITWKEINLNNGGSSFSLPYAGTGSSNDKLFSINNTSTANASVGIYGKLGVGGTVALGTTTVGVWGDNPTGTGVYGTSNTNAGVYGLSLGYHSIYGEGTAAGFAGVYGLANSIATFGIMGEAANSQTIGVYGRAMTIGKPAFFEIADSSNYDTAMLVKSVGTGVALNVQQNNPYNFKNTLSTITKGSGSALFAQSEQGIAGYFKKINNGNISEVVSVENNALSGAGVFVNMKNGSTTDPAVSIKHLGQGNGVSINLSSPANPLDMIDGFSNGVGGGIHLTLANTISAGDGINVHTEGTGYAINASSKKSTVALFYTSAGNNSDVISLDNPGNGESINIFQSSPTNSKIALRSYTAGNGAAVAGLTEGTGAALSGTSFGTGPGLLINNLNANAVSSLATFQKGGTNRARIDGTGKGFFNGGTQNSGADLAEVFDVTGNIQQYEMGDVLVISTDKDRTVEKSSGAYSTLVAGVYATKPGVLLTEENIDTDISGKVPMGVVGVIPTKVCLEGGEIKRGDLLVTSSTPGAAMKADIEKVKPGQVIGKALENYNGNSIGKIKVLVNVK